MAKSKGQEGKKKKVNAKNYDIELTAKAEKEVLVLDDKTFENVSGAIDKLVSNPRPAGVRKLKGRKNEWRVRVGRYRILYAIDDSKKHILIYCVTHRKEIYRK